MTEKKKKRDKNVWFIEVVGDPNATKSEAARKSMELLKTQLQSMKKKPKEVF